MWLETKDAYPELENKSPIEQPKNPQMWEREWEKKVNDPERVITNKQEAKALRNSKKALENMKSPENANDELKKEFRWTVFLSDITWLNLLQYQDSLPDWIDVEKEFVWRWWNKSSSLVVSLWKEWDEQKKIYGTKWLKNRENDIDLTPHFITRWIDAIQDISAVRNLTPEDKSYLAGIALKLIDNIVIIKTEYNEERLDYKINKNEKINNEKQNIQDNARWPQKLFAGMIAKRKFNLDKRDIEEDINRFESDINKLERLKRKLLSTR
jgi:hypothetical protein